MESNEIVYEKLLTEFESKNLSDWEQEVSAALDGKPIEKLNSLTYENIILKPLYTKKDLEDLSFSKENLPGNFPYLRGTEFGGIKTSKWTITQDFNTPDPVEFNSYLLNGIKNGLGAVNLKFDVSLLTSNDDYDEENPDTYNIDFDKPNIHTESGTFITTIDDLIKCFEGVDLTKYSVNLNASSFSVMALSVFVAFLKSKSYDLSKICGSIETDPINSLLVTGDLYAPVDDIKKEIKNIIKISENYLPEFKVLGLNGQNYRESGGNAIQELAFSFASAVLYINWMLDEGFEINQIASKFQFNFVAGPTFFVEIAKFRAARIIWAKIIKEFGGNEESQKLNFSVKSLNWNKSKLDPYVNMLRSTTETISAVLGGANSITVSEFNANSGITDEFSQRISRNIQNVLLNECNLADTIDPAGGSFFIEKVTQQIAESVWGLFVEVEKQGGMLNSVLSGFPQQEIKKVASKKSKDIETRKEILLGTNKHANLNDGLQTDQEDVLDEILEQSTKQVIKILERFEQRIEKPELEKLTKAFIEGSDELHNFFINAAEQDCNLIELADAIRINEGEFFTEPLYLHRASEPFEELRIKTEELKVHFGTNPKIFLANFGTLKQYKARAEFSAEFLSVGGFDCISSSTFTNYEELVNEFEQSGCRVIVLCSADDTYPEIVPEVVQYIKKSPKKSMILLAGYPAEYVDNFKLLGIDEFIHLKANIIEVLSKIQNYICDLSENGVDNE